VGAPSSRDSTTPRLMPISDAARALGVSIDTLRRWERAGRLTTQRDAANRRVVSEDEVHRLGGRELTRTDHGLSARNRFAGVVREVEVSGVVALVTIDAGPFTVVSVITRDSVEELGLAPGVEAVATVKATSVMVERQ
jgi:molybdopterin-binding protein